MQNSIFLTNFKAQCQSIFLYEPGYPEGYPPQEITTHVTDEIIEEDDDNVDEDLFMNWNCFRISITTLSIAMVRVSGNSFSLQKDCLWRRIGLNLHRWLRAQGSNPCQST